MERTVVLVAALLCLATFTRDLKQRAATAKKEGTVELSSGQSAK
jgi:hypothetical protein